MPRSLIVTFGLLITINLIGNPADNQPNHIRLIEENIEKSMKEGDIPGLCLSIISDEKEYIKSFGYSDLENKIKVSENTLFELGSCSKAYTALAILKLEKMGEINFEDKISQYLPWFEVRYNDSSNIQISIFQLLYHTSGIPTYAISLIPESNHKKSLEETVRKVVNIELSNYPGESFSYSTINYDVLGLLIETVTNKSFEEFVKEHVLLPLDLTNTYVGHSPLVTNLSKGYKIGFFKPRLYEAPIFKGNVPAGYFISDIKDVTKWLRFQIGIDPTGLSKLINLSHERNKYVAPMNLLSYAKGWFVSLNGNNNVLHGGYNPNFTTFIGFNKEKRIGVAILTNSNSGYTNRLGLETLKLLDNKQLQRNFNPDKGFDQVFSVISLLLCFYIFSLVLFSGYLFYGIITSQRKLEGLNLIKLKKIFITLLCFVPFLYAIYLFPKAFLNFSWKSIIIWAPVSFEVMVFLLLASMLLSYIIFIITELFVEKNELKRKLPQVLIMSILSGLSSMCVILMITKSFGSDMKLRYLLMYFGLCLFVYILGRNYVQVNLIRVSRNLIYDLRIKIFNKLFSTSYEKFENLDRGKIYSSLNDDIGTIGGSINTIVGLITNAITAIGAFVYLASIAFWSTTLTIVLVGSISTIYYFVSRSTQNYFEEARNTRDVFMRLLNSMIDGFKELSIHRKKKKEFKSDVAHVANEYRKKISYANIKFVKAFLVGETMLLLVLGIVAFILPKLFPNLGIYTLMSFVIILLYMIGPVNEILSSVPAFMQLRIARNRIKEFIEKIPANMDLNAIPKLINKNEVESFRITNLKYTYKSVDERKNFTVGPIDFTVQKGEVLFIIGGNGSGKSTLARMITGLCTPDFGNIFVNNKRTESSDIGEYFSTVFNPFHLFQKLYSMDLSQDTQKAALKEFLNILQLDKKVEILDNEYSTIDLSGGQRKRLALLQCYLEDKPIYLFDEWAADQDPEYRKYFYRELIPKMKSEGKIIIAITHDDHYFDVADQILKLDMGTVDYIKDYSEIKNSVIV